MPIHSQPRDDAVYSQQIGGALARRHPDVRLPNFLVVGAEKCGTTSLYQYLKQHRDVYLPSKKELHYFAYYDIAKSVAGPGDPAVLAYACSSWAAYQSYYMGVDARAVGEVSPSYFYYSEVSDKIYSTLDQPKIIIMLRNPIQKAHSQYMHLVRDNRETLSFFDALMAERDRIKAGWGPLWRYAEGALYSARVARYMEVFGEGKVKIGFFEELSKDPQTVVNELLRFIGVEPDRSIDTSRVYNKSGRPRSRRLADFLTKPNAVTAAARRWIPEQARDRIRNAMLNLNTGRKDAIDDRSRAYLRDRFTADVGELQQILRKPLTWLD
jgi:hypothetical protein